MHKFIIEGGFKLQGNVKISGSKNAALPILVATMLSSEESVIGNVPDLDDVKNMKQILMNFGIKISYSGKNNCVLHIIGKDFFFREFIDETAKKLRASILVLGSLLAKEGKAEIFFPGGCEIGIRPINLHIDGLAQMGAKINIENNYIKASVKNGRLRGARIKFDFPSVGATENIMMAATLANGTTIIENAAREPEIIELAEALNSMGSDINGAGTRIIRINGQKSLKGMRHNITPDRIEIGTFIAAAVVTRGDIFIQNIQINKLKSILMHFEKIGCKFYVSRNGIKVNVPKQIKNTYIKTAPYPGFPTDMQAQFMSCLCIASGISYIQENIWENRFMHMPELVKMGANIISCNNLAIIHGVDKLKGTQITATDLRASAGLIIAALGAEGVSEISQIHHLDRGYVALEQKLTKLGARVSRVSRL